MPSFHLLNFHFNIILPSMPRTSKWSICLHTHNCVAVYSLTTCFDRRGSLSGCVAHFIFSNFFRKSCCLWDNVEKYGGAREAVDSMVHARCVWISKVTSAQAQACPRAAKRTHTDQYVILIAFPQQQWFRESASLLRYTYIVCLVKKYCNHFNL